MNSGRIAACVSIAWCCVIPLSCFDSQNGGTPDAAGAADDAGDGGLDASVGPGDATLGGLDGSHGDGGAGGALDSGAGGSDSGADGGGDGGSGPFTSCDPKTPVDQTGGVNGAESVRAVAYGDKQVALWMIDSQVSSDNQGHFNARAADLGVWGNVFDLGVGNYYPSPFLVTDGAGRGFVQYTGSTTVRGLYDFTSQTFSSPITFAGSANVGAGSDSALVGLAAGGAISLYTNYATTPTLMADKWNPSTAQWEATSLGVAGGTYELNAQANPATSKLGYAFYNNNGATVVLNLGAYDGTAWVTDAATFPQEAGTPGNFTVGVYTNGDLLVAYYSPSDGAPVAARYHVTGKTWDPAVVLDPGGSYVSALHVAIDGSDRATVVWQRNGAHGFARRNLGSGWAPPTDLGIPAASASGYRLALDASSNAYILTSSAATGDLVLWRAAATSDTFATPYSTGLSSMSGALSANINMDRDTALTFDGAGHPLVFADLIPPAKDGGVGYSLYTTRCH